MEKLKACLICGAKAFVNHLIVNGFSFGWSVGCPRACIADGIHGFDDYKSFHAARLVLHNFETKDACMAVLKPCPFCGSKWTQVRWIGFVNGPPCGYASGYRGECTDCGAMTLPALSVEAAEEAWNRRAE